MTYLFKKKINVSLFSVHLLFLKSVKNIDDKFNKGNIKKNNLFFKSVYLLKIRTRFTLSLKFNVSIWFQNPIAIKKKLISQLKSME